MFHRSQKAVEVSATELTEVLYEISPKYHKTFYASAASLTKSTFHLPNINITRDRQ
jgi:hypothetical protein